MRAFVAAALPAEVIGMLTETQGRMRATLGRTAVKWARPDAMHLTLRFLGEVPDDREAALGDALRTACAPVAPFCLESGGLGCFPSIGHPRVVWIGLEGETDCLAQLAASIAEATDSFIEGQQERAFVPHLTLGRIGEIGRCEAEALSKAVTSIAPAPVRWRVESACLMRSILRPKGAEHIPLADLPLAGADQGPSDPVGNG